jgi:Mg2+/Co2+ transporter CorB
MMGWKIPIDEAKTINGAILENLGYIPEVDAEFTLGNYLVSVITTKENAVETIKIKDIKDDFQLKVVS